ncbi:MAG: FAD-dependent oxidoreductase [Proteobacteria bacterium]|nr:FAD-dependent oxidoreductase [Pseudomonadota bacterium]
MNDERQTTDVVIVGSGAAGLLAAVRAHDLGLSSIVIEKSARYGGTSAVSGGAIWIPNNGGSPNPDSPEQALEYLRSVTQGLIPEAKLARYVDEGPQMLAHLKQLGIRYYTHPLYTYPDYYPSAPGALPGGRTMFVPPMDGSPLGDEFFRMREANPEHKLLGKIALDVIDGVELLGRLKGWQRTLFRLLFRYWSNLTWRRRTYRDQRLTNGMALIGGLRKALADRNIPLRLKTSLTRILMNDGRVSGIVVEHEGRELQIAVSRGVILASGGFEQSQALRDRYLDQPTMASWSATPSGNNTGEALLAAIDVGADTEFMNEAWWCPTVPTPTGQAPNTVRSVALFYERAFPHSLAVNRLGKRFVNEASSYHQFGQAMLRDNAATGANLPCWLVFDASFRTKYPLGSLLPGSVVPDTKLPPDWLDNLLYRADSLAALAEKIGLPAPTLAATVAQFNACAHRGVDEEFGRGGNFHNLYYGDPTHQPNRTLGEVQTAPFYAVRIDLGDIGTKGGPKTDQDARVLDKAGQPIPGLYAVGNVAGSVMGSTYPGAGATLGSSMTFACVAAAHLAQASTG